MKFTLPVAVSLLALAWSARSVHWFARFTVASAIPVVCAQMPPGDLLVLVIPQIMLIVIAIIASRAVHHFQERGRRIHRETLLGALKSIRFSTSWLLLFVAAASIAIFVSMRFPGEAVRRWFRGDIDTLYLAGSYAALAATAYRMSRSKRARPVVVILLLSLLCAWLLYDLTLAYPLDLRAYERTARFWQWTLVMFVHGSVVWLVCRLVRGWAGPSLASGGNSHRARGWRRLCAGSICGLILVALFAPLTVVFYYGLQQSPIHRLPLPVDNRYGDLVRIGEQIYANFEGTKSGEVDSFYELPDPQLQSFVTLNRPLIVAARKAMQGPYRPPIEYGYYGAYDFSSLSSGYGPRVVDAILPWIPVAFEAERRWAAAEHRVDDEIEACVDLVRLGNKAGQGGLIMDVCASEYAKYRGLVHLHRMRQQLSDEACRTLVDMLERIPGEREEFETVIERTDAYERACFHWSRRLELAAEPVGWQKLRCKLIYDRCEATRCCIVADLAIQRFRLANGRLPHRLDELVPSYLTCVPADPYGSGSIVYRRTSTGYLLYSIDQDRRDDGGIEFLPKGRQFPPADVPAIGWRDGCGDWHLTTESTAP